MPTLIERGAIVENVAYPLPLFRELTGMGAPALREARKKGLLVRRVGLRSYILGRDFLTFLERDAKIVSPNGNPIAPAPQA